MGTGTCTPEHTWAPHALAVQQWKGFWHAVCDSGTIWVHGTLRTPRNEPSPPSSLWPQESIHTLGDHKLQLKLQRGVSHPQGHVASPAPIRVSTFSKWWPAVRVGELKLTHPRAQGPQGFLISVSVARESPYIAWFTAYPPVSICPSVCVCVHMLCVFLSDTT